MASGGKERGNGSGPFMTYGQWHRDRDSGPSSEPPRHRHHQERLQWLKWLGATVVAIFLGGFMVATYMGRFAESEKVRSNLSSYRDKHTGRHDEMKDRLTKVESKVNKIHVEQARSSEREKLINARIELIAEQTDSEKTYQERKTSRSRMQRIRREIEERQDRLRKLEQDPAAGLGDL